jgi:LCP family protein required for cell wall assembly
VAGLLVLALLAGLSLDAARLVSQVQRLDLPAVAAQAPGETWVIVGSDNRAYKPEGEDLYGAGQAGPGDRADLILVVQVPAGGAQPARVMSVPRDLLLILDQGPNRLNLTLNDGPAAFAQAMCTGLGIPVEHLVVVTMKGLVEVVDALGGLELDVVEPVDDPKAHLVLAAGRQVLDGETVLALVRSRHPSGDVAADGDQVAQANHGTWARASNGALVFAALAEQARGALTQPLVARRLAYAAAGGVWVDRGTGLFDLAGVLRQVAGSDTEPVVLTVQDTESDILKFPSEQTYAELADWGYVPGACAVAQ